MINYLPQKSNRKLQVLLMDQQVSKNEN